MRPPFNAQHHRTMDADNAQHEQHDDYRDLVRRLVLYNPPRLFRHVALRFNDHMEPINLLDAFNTIYDEDVAAQKIQNIYRNYARFRKKRPKNARKKG